MSDTAQELVARPSPAVTAESSRYWAAGLEGVLLIGSCGVCGEVHHPPQAVCPTCWCPASEVAATGDGNVEAFSIVHRTSSPAFRGRVPYVVAYVRLNEGPALFTNIVGCSVDEVAIGMPVRAVFERISDSVALPLFRPIPKELT